MTTGLPKQCDRLSICRSLTFFRYIPTNRTAAHILRSKHFPLREVGAGSSCNYLMTANKDPLLNRGSTFYALDFGHRNINMDESR
jgi:hypothetical protein